MLRVGGTEWQNNVMGWHADCRPLPTLYVQPEKPDVEDEMRGRLRKLFESSQQLSRLIPAGEWASGEQLRLTTQTIYAGYASSENTLIRKTIGLAVFDEIDNCERIAGSLGNTLDLIAERLVTFGPRGLFIQDGTPNIASASGWQSLQHSDYRKPHVPCPHCGTYQVLSFDRLILAPGHEKERDPDRIEAEQLVRYQCAECDELIDHETWHKWMIDRTWWIPRGQSPRGRLPVREARGEPVGNSKVSKSDRAEARRIVEVESLAVPPYDPWDARYKDHVQWTPLLDGEAPQTKRRGYWINVLYSPWASRTWSHILAQWFRSKDDPDKRRVFTNSWLAEPFEDAVQKLDWQQLGEKRAARCRPCKCPARPRS